MSSRNLEGLMLLARLGENLGVDLGNYQTAVGRGIRRAFDYLVPFATDGPMWPDRQFGELSAQALVRSLDSASGRSPDSRYLALLKNLKPSDPTSRAHWLRRESSESRAKAD